MKVGASMKRALKVIAINVALLAVLLVPLELAFGGWLDPGFELRRLGIPRSVNREYDVSGLYETDRSRIRHARNAYGLRPASIVPRDAAIVTVGGSTTEQTYLDDDDTFQRAMEARFRAAGRTVRVANAGIDGQSTVGHAATLVRWIAAIPDLHPNLILFVVGINDAANPEVGALDYDTAFDASSPLVSLIRTNSAVYDLLRKLRGAFVARRANVAHAAWPADRPTQRYTFELASLTGYSRVLETAYSQRLARLDRETRSMGARPIFVTQGTRHGPCRRMGESLLECIAADRTEAEYVAKLHLVNLATRAYAMRSNAPLLDLYADVVLEGRDFYDLVHNTPSGAQKIGRYLADGIVERGLLERGG